MSVFAGKRIALASDSDLSLALAVALSRAGACIVASSVTAEAVWNAGGVLAREGGEADLTINLSPDGSVIVRSCAEA